VDTVLVRAESPKVAYEKALKFGRDRELHYANTDGKSVQSLFKGLRDLTVVFDRDLEDGTELIFEEIHGLDGEGILRLISAKEDLSVFISTNQGDA
jgi:hypothetical protein